MYQVLHFRGGMYKFNELSEFVDDVGGLLLSKDQFEIIRGDSYLSTEVHVLIMVPEGEMKSLLTLISEIKGMSENVDISEGQRINLFAYLSIFDVLNKNDSWIEKEELKSMMFCPCYAILCKNIGDNSCILNDKFEEVLEEMMANGIIESQILEGKIFYRLKEE